jgi:hypothetical protein
MDDIKEKEIKDRAFEIYRRRKQEGFPGDCFSDWMQAINQLKHNKEVMDNWNSGTV